MDTGNARPAAGNWSRTWTEDQSGGEIHPELLIYLEGGKDVKIRLQKFKRSSNLVFCLLKNNVEESSSELCQSLL